MRISTMRLTVSAEIRPPQLHLQFPLLPPILPTAAAAAAATAFRQLPLKLRHRHRSPPLKSHHPQLPNPETTTTTSAAAASSDDSGIPIEHVTTLAKFKSRHNYIRVLQVSRAADHPLAGSRLLLLDAPGNIHSISYIFKTLTDSYFDVFATLPPILPPGPIAILGFGAGSAARIILDLYPEATVHGWELDPAVVSVAREYFGLEKLEKKHGGRLFIRTGNALNANSKSGFAGIIVDLFRKGRVIPELQDPATWEGLKRSLRRGGRMMVNVGGSCVEPEDVRSDGGLIMAETLKAMDKVFPGKVRVLSTVDGREDDSSVAMTGAPPDAAAWKEALRQPLRLYVDMWRPYCAGGGVKSHAAD
ncbi:S-adenosyl-L-methionine-dependentmethyltransferase domain-containing protein [Striga asiatica]|uniref:S-adenosyl-L-methionine-dependentmethyltransferase domain-containing protein n=1 Tax=Striga asiatica TaxID=4170 RepID=A0A5A7RI03_STRAF|nr:S-adenosyl-L-methionine-dependentmethyltransferase domain-containing protein [Striga asiatica]